MPDVELKLPSLSRGYTIHIGDGGIESAGALLSAAGLSGKAVVVSDAKVAPLHGPRLKKVLEDGGFQVAELQIPVGEQHKSLETAMKLYEQLDALRSERMTPIVALGGGVVGDLTGFVAATYLRGVPLVQVPTTILAQADSSIGGKVAVNHGGLKNRIGAFYHPRLTISDQSLLKTLNQREVSDGLAEVIKYGVTMDDLLFEFLEQNMDEIRSLDEAALETIIAIAAELKARVVEKDEFDLGFRNILNYGHTIGHAVETVSKLAVWHGEAVAIGMLAEARIAQAMGSMTTSEVVRLEKLVSKAGLPTVAEDVDSDAILAAMMLDKKVTDGRLKFALPKSIGDVYLTSEVPESVIREVLE